MGGGTILLFLVLLAIRLDMPARMFPGGEGEVVTLLPKRVPIGEAWMNITQHGRKIGYSRRSYGASDKGFTFSEDVFMKIGTMGVVQPMTIRTAAELKPDGTLSTFRFDLGSNLFAFTVRGALDGKQLTLHTGPAGSEKTSVMTLKEIPYLGNGILESIGTEGLKPGEGRTFPVFDPASLGQRPVKVSFLGDERLVVMGKSQRARKFSVDFMGMKQVAWVGRDGVVLREEGILGIVLARVTKETALAGLEGALSADMTEIAAIASPRPIEAPDALKVLRVRLAGLPGNPLDLDGGRQLFRDGLLTIKRESRPDRPAHRTLRGEELAESLQSTPFIQADHPKIKKQAAEIVAPGDSEEDKAKKIVDWVYGNIEKRPVLSVPNALETLENRVGDCNEHAVLLAALARAAGIPADIEAGVVYMRGRFYYHAWNILYLPGWGGWVTADAVLGQMPADVTHIRFVRGAADRQLDLVTVIGKVKLESLEMER